ncbi:hypothetical protein HanPI659440_Chr08g0310261 [Helianthus annuus]|nr:hypothetical protein HanPI659440_Chr08g0310261 [Helianthus annuus]
MNRGCVRSLCSWTFGNIFIYVHTFMFIYGYSFKGLFMLYIYFICFSFKNFESTVIQYVFANISHLLVSISICVKT